MELLARREHGSAELKTKLTKRFRKRHCEPELLEQVIQHLIDEGLLSDERFAASRVRQLAGRGYGPSRIRNDLRQQRVEHLVSDTMDEAFDSEVDWEAEATVVYKKNSWPRPAQPGQTRLGQPGQARPGQFRPGQLKRPTLKLWGSPKMLAY